MLKFVHQFLGLSEHFELKLHVFVVLGPRDLNLLRADSEVVEYRIVDHSGREMESPLVVKQSSCKRGVIISLYGRLAPVLLLVLDRLLKDNLVLARYIVQLEHELFGEGVVSLSLLVDAVLRLTRDRRQFFPEFLE